MSSNITVQRICEFCHHQFTARTSVTRFCSGSCSNKSAKAKAKALKLDRSNEQTVEAAQELKRQLLNKAFLSVKDIAELLGFSKQGVYNLIIDGQLKALSITVRRKRVKQDDFQEFLARRAANPVTEEKAAEEKKNKVLTRGDCYSVEELTVMFNKNRADLYVFLKRALVSKIKIKKEVFFSKSEVDRLFRKFTSPKQLGHDKERAANIKLAEKGFKVSDCYSMEQCKELFNLKRANLYNKFSLRKVPKIRQGQSVYYLKKSVDRIYKGFKRGGNDE